MLRHLQLFLALPALVAACSTPPPDLGTLELIETFPIETSLDQPDLREAHTVWPELIEEARERIDCAWFYVSDAPGSRLRPFLDAIEEAAARGVKVRVLSDSGFHDTYPEILDSLGAREGIEVRLFDVRALTGGVLHAKYFLVDDEVTFLGSQNCDWRSMEHIQELGVLVRSAPLQGVYRALFEDDWARAGGEAFPEREAPAQPVELAFGSSRVRARSVASPQDWLPSADLWDLPHLVKAIDEASARVRVQLLTYRTRERDGSSWTVLEDALLRAAARGVEVELLVADWGKRKNTIEGLQQLALNEGIDVFMATIPQWSGGFVPFARVIHAKFMVIDGNWAWIGTSNWERGYFHASRNVGLVVEGAAFGERLDAYFATVRNGPYVEAVDPEREYEAPRVGP